MNPNPKDTMDNYIKLQKIGLGSGGCKVYKMKDLENGHVNYILMFIDLRC